MDTVILSAALTLGVVSVLVALVAYADRRLPARCVQERHDIALLAYAAAPLTFVLGLRPADAIPHFSSVAPPPVSGVAEPGATASGMTEAFNLVSSSAPPLAGFSGWTPGFALWCAVSLILLIRLGRDLYAIRQLKASSHRSRAFRTTDLSRRIPIRHSDAILCPMLIGYLRPMILLPNTPDDRPVPTSVLEHEVAHAIHGDAWSTLGMRLVDALFWWVLPLRLLKPVIHRARELRADSYAAERTGNPVELAHALLDSAVSAPPALATGAADTALGERVRRLGQASAWRARPAWAGLRTLMPLFLAISWAAVPRLGIAESNSTGRLPDATDWSERDSQAAVLYQAAARGTLEDVRNLVAEGADSSAWSAGDGTPLMAAVRREHDEIFLFLLADGADPNVVARGDGTALIAAVRSGRLDYVEQLLAAGADPNLAVSGDGNPLIIAAKAGRTPIVQRLLGAGADVNAYVFGDETPLVNAAANGHLDIVDLLIGAGADVSLTVRTGRSDAGGPYRSPLSEARRKGHRHVVERLLEVGATHQPVDNR